MAKLFKANQRIIDSVAEMDRSDAEKSTTELWCLNTSLKLQNERDEPERALKCLKQASDIIAKECQAELDLKKDILAKSL